MAIVGSLCNESKVAVREASGSHRSRPTVEAIYSLPKVRQTASDVGLLSGWQRVSAHSSSRAFPVCVLLGIAMPVSTIRDLTRELEVLLAEADDEIRDLRIVGTLEQIRASRATCI